MRDEAIRSTLRWLPGYFARRLTRGARPRGARVIVAIADHFEPSFNPDRPSTHVALPEQEARLDAWLREYPTASGDVRDADGCPLRHTLFFPAEQYVAGLLDRIAAFCREGWGELEVHLHHGVGVPATAAETREILRTFRDQLVAHGALSRWQGSGEARYAFVHGNWALANSRRGRYCGVDNELEILAETGCYADMTLPALFTDAQVTRVNSVYECVPPIGVRQAYRRGRVLERGRAPATYPLMVQGPLAAYFVARGARSVIPKIESGELARNGRPFEARYDHWRSHGATVRGRPDWIFVKLHCHGMDPRDRDLMVGDGRRAMLAGIARAAGTHGDRLYFATAREMVNMLLAACDGREGEPGEYRDYRLQLIRAAG